MQLRDTKQLWTPAKQGVLQSLDGSKLVIKVGHHGMLKMGIQVSKQALYSGTMSLGCKFALENAQ